MFDTLDHDILLTKLYEYGFRGEVKDLLRGYLGDRAQHVSVSGETTSRQKIEPGEPHRSILGPLLTLCGIDCKIVLFADDTSILRTNWKNDTGIQQDVKVRINGYTAKKLSVNLDTCEILPSGSRKPNENQMKKFTILYKMSYKHLGIHFDSSSRFDHHIGYVVKKLSNLCDLIYRIRHLHDKNVFIVLQHVCKNCYLLWFSDLQRSC